MTRSFWILCAAGGSAALLLGALAFQHLGGLAPCKLCIWQRWPHGAAIVIGAFALMLPGRVLPLAGLAAALITAGVGAYHSAVERGWLEGPDTCTTGPIADVSAEDLLNQILAAPMVRCDEVAWSFLSLSMASWNAVFSLALAACWLRVSTLRA